MAEKTSALRDDIIQLKKDLVTADYYAKKAQLERDQLASVIENRRHELNQYIESMPKGRMDELIDKAHELASEIYVAETVPDTNIKVTGPKYQVNQHIWFKHGKDKLYVEFADHYTTKRFMGGKNTGHTGVIEISFNRGTQTYNVGLNHNINRSHRDNHTTTFDEALTHLVSSMTK